MSTTEKTYCSLYTFIKRTNQDLYDILDDMCAIGLVRTRNDITFLNPNGNLTNQLIDLIEKDQSEKASDLFKSLFIYGKHTSLNKDVVNYNHKKYGEDLSGLKQLSSFKQWKDSQNVSVLDYKSDKFPKEGESAERPVIQRTKGKGKRGGNDDHKREYTNELMETKDHHKIIYALNSLLNYVRTNNTERFASIKQVIDPNMVLSWYIIVQPGKTTPDYVSHDMFNEWKKNNKIDELSTNTDVIQHILKDIEPS